MRLGVVVSGAWMVRRAVADGPDGRQNVPMSGQNTWVRYGADWQAVRQQVFGRWGHICHWCGGYAGTVDHVVALIHGGGHELENLVPACRRCNSRRGAIDGNRLRGRRRRLARAAGSAARPLQGRSRDW